MSAQLDLSSNSGKNRDEIRRMLKQVVRGQNGIVLYDCDPKLCSYYALLLTAFPFSIFFISVAIGQADILSFYFWVCIACLVASLPFMGAALIEKMSDALSRGHDHTDCRVSIAHQDAIAIYEEGAANVDILVAVGLDRDYAPEVMGRENPKSPNPQPHSPQSNTQDASYCEGNQTSSCFGNQNPVPQNPKLSDWLWQGWKIRYTVIHNPQSQVPVILLHGFGGSIGHWRQNIAELAKYHTVYALDLLGFGASEKPIASYGIGLWVEQVYEFWQTFVQVPAVLVGNSIGSVISLTAAATHPEMARGVVMISLPDTSSSEESIPAAIRPLVRRLKIALTSPLVLQPLFHLVRQPWIVKRWAGLAYACKEAITDELLEILTAPARDLGSATAFCAILKAMLSPRFSPCVRSILTNLKIPSLLLWGQQDRMIPLELARRFLGYNPTLQLIEVENAGHCPHDERPEQVNQELLSWIQTQVLATV
jgi:pimeloyl-ACP methyl ester carboxylesterase